jgi:hypothetical protein
MNDVRFKNEYPELSTITMVFNVIGIGIIVFAVIGLTYGVSLFVGQENERQMGIYLIISAFLGGVLLSTPFFAFIELIKLLVRIEFNTRKDTIDLHSKKDHNAIDHQLKTVSAKNDLSFEDWKKINPTKTINDYYASSNEH